MAETAHPLVVRAREAFARSEIKSAENAVEERLRMAGRDINALEMRYLIQKARGQLGEAARTLDSVIGINSRADWAHNELIQLLMTHGKVADAEQVARAALRANPDNAKAHELFGLIISNAGELPAGEWHLRQALKGEPPAASCLTHLANNLTRQGRVTEAEELFSRAHDVAPDDVKTLTSWAALREARGDFAGAEDLIGRATAAAPEEVTLSRANLLGKRARHEEALATLNAAKELSGEAQLTRGRMHERLGRYDEAWQDFVAAKRKLAAEAGGLQYKSDAVEGLFGRFKQFFTRENMARMPRAQTRGDVPQPVFIMGWPCSGAPTVERIIANHSAATAGGELPFLGELRKVAGDALPSQQAFPENLAQSWTADRYYAVTLFRDYYLARAERHGLLAAGKTVFTDRMPFNSVYLPLLKMAFPQAKIVHIQRNPLDACASILASQVTQGFNCAYRIEDASHHLAAVFDLYEHYRREIDVGDYALRYEALIADPQAQTRKLLDYLGLPFEENCLRLQGSESLDDGCGNRHRHYAQQLKPYVGRLRPILAAYGYE